MFDIFNTQKQEEKRSFDFKISLGEFFSFGIFFDCKLNIKDFVDNAINKISILPLSSKDKKSNNICTG